MISIDPHQSPDLLVVTVSLDFIGRQIYKA